MSLGGLAPSRSDDRGKRPVALTLSAVVSGALIVTLCLNLDVRLVGETLLRADPMWLFVSVGMIIPITALRALRFYWVAPKGSLPSQGEALRLTLVASALNVFAPAKAGDIIKSYFIAKRSSTPRAVALAIVVYERLCDLFGLITCCLVGWLVGKPRIPGLPTAFWWLLASVGVVCALLISSVRMALILRGAVERLFAHKKMQKIRTLADGWPGLLNLLSSRCAWIIAYSVVLWLAHLFQIWLFTIALSVDIPFTVCASLSAVALMAGQLPLTVAGMGTRDIALVALLGHYTSSETAAALGVLVLTRGLLPPLLGLPVIKPYLSLALDDARLWRQGVSAS